MTARTLLVAFVGCISCRQAGPGIHPDSTLASLAPADATIAAGIDIAALRAAPLYQKNADAFHWPDVAGYAPLEQQADKVSSVLVVWRSDAPLILARGDITRQAIESALVSHGMRQSANGLFTTPGGTAVSFPEKGVVEMGRENVLAHPLAGGLPEGIRQWLRDLPKADQIWFVSTQGVPPSAIPRTTDPGAALASIAGYVHGAAAGLQVDSGLHLQANLACASAQGAKQVHDALRGFIALGRLMLRDNQQDLLHVYDAIKVDQDGSNVHVHAEISPELSQKLMQYLKSSRLSLRG